MHLQKQLSRKVGEKEYAKWVLVIPPKIIAELGWTNKTDLEIEIKGDKLVIEED